MEFRHEHTKWNQNPWFIPTTIPDHFIWECLPGNPQESAPRFRLFLNNENEWLTLQLVHAINRETVPLRKANESNTVICNWLYSWRLLFSMSIDRAITLDSRNNSLWFCITTTLDWLKILAPLSQPIRSQIKFWMVWWFAIVFWNWSEWLQSTIPWSRDTRLCGCRSTHHPTIRQILWRYWINSIKIYQQDWGGGIKEQFLYDSYIYKWREILLNEMDSWGLIMAIIV